MDKITNSIWIGDSKDAANGQLETHGINAILNVASDLHISRGHNHGIHYSQCGLMDGPGNSLASYYSAILQLGHLVGSDKNVLVHCHAGWSRSPSVVAMYLNATGRREGWDHYMNLIAKARPSICPSKAHEQAFNQLDWMWLATALRF